MKKAKLKHKICIQECLIEFDQGRGLNVGLGQLCGETIKHGLEVHKAIFWLICLCLAHGSNF